MHVIVPYRNMRRLIVQIHVVGYLDEDVLLSNKYFFKQSRYRMFLSFYALTNVNCEYTELKIYNLAKNIT